MSISRVADACAMTWPPIGFLESAESALESALGSAVTWFVINTARLNSSAILVSADKYLPTLLSG
jgi:hypothetical protein